MQRTEGTGERVGQVEQSYRDHLAAVKRQVREQTPAETAERLGATPAPAILDVRERDEYEQGYIPGAVHLPRGNLESRIERLVPDRSTPVIIYCAAGNRSVYAAKTLAELGYEDVVSMAGGFAAWKQNGHDWRVPRALNPEQFERYSRHVLIPEVGEEGQLKLLDSKVLLIGAGGLGSPAALYLAAAGVGTLGIIDADVVDVSNLQRQILHTVDRVGQPKVDSAEIAIKAHQPGREGEQVRRAARLRERARHHHRLRRDRRRHRQLPHPIPAERRQPGRRHPGRPRLDLPVRGLGHGLQAARRPVLPLPVPRASAAGAGAVCAEGGVLGVLPGVIGTLQATEAVKLLLGIGEPLVGRQLRYDALAMEFVELKMHRDPECPVCSKDPSEIEFIDYEQFCAMPSRALARPPRRPLPVSTVRMPPILRQAVGGAREVDASGATVREVLADLAERFPGVSSTCSTSRAT